MIQFKVSVPGSINLFGEHVICNNGGVGVMGSIDLRTRLTFEEISNSTSFLHIDFPHVRQTLNVPLEEFIKLYNYCVQDIESLNEQVQKLTKHLYKSPNHMVIMQAFIYLFIYIAYKEQIKIKAFKMILSTEFLVDNEFACSTSIIICFVTCFLNWSCLQKGVTDTFDDANIKKIQSYATHYEEVSFHLQFGIVNVFTCLYGSLTQYRYGNIARFEKGMPSMTILLVDSKEETQILNAHEQQVAELMNTTPELIHPIFNIINDVTRCVYYIFQILVNISKDKNLDAVSRLNRTTAQIKMLEMFIRTNQQLLECFNVADPVFVRHICLTAQKYGMCGKSADNGRFVYIWCSEHVDESCIHKELFTTELNMQGFDVMETKFDHEGTKIEVVENLKINLNE